MEQLAQSSSGSADSSNSLDPASALPGFTQHRVLRHGPALLLLVVMGSLLIGTERHQSPTVDEPHHLSRGLSYWWMNDTRLSYSHPPLANALMAAPAAMDGPREDFSENSAWAAANNAGITRLMRDADYGRLRERIRSGRAVVIALTLLLGLYVYWWCLRFFGWSAAVAALALYALHPTILGRGWLLLTDIPVALCMTVALGEFVPYLMHRGARQLAVLAVAVGAAFATKFSAFILIPVMGAIGVFCSWRRFGRFADGGFCRRMLRLLGDAIVVALVALVVVNASYRFEGTGWTVQQILDHPEPAVYLTRKFDGEFLEDKGRVGRLPRNLRVPLPYSYIYGAETVASQSDDGHQSYFLGSPTQGHWAYYPVLLCLKNTEPVLILVAISAVLLARRKRRGDSAALILLAALGLLVAVVVPTGINLGMRHVLTQFVLMILVAGRGAALFWERYGARRWAGPAAAALLLVAVANAAAYYPDYQTYFNFLAGGRAGGDYFSVIDEDLGQDTVALAERITEGDLQPLFYEPITEISFAELDHHLGHLGQAVTQLRRRRPPPTSGFVALHKGKLYRSKDRDRDYPWLEPGQQPVEVIRHNIEIYRFDPQ